MARQKAPPSTDSTAAKPKPKGKKKSGAAPTGSDKKAAAPRYPAQPQALSTGSLALLTLACAVGLPASKVAWKTFIASLPENRVAKVHTVPLLSREECENIIDSTNGAEKVSDSWDLAHDPYLQTRDWALSAVAGKDYASEIIESRVKPVMSRLFRVDVADITLDDLHIVEYSGDEGQESKGRQGVPVHQDQSSISVNIALSPPESFQGGGTYFRNLDATLTPPQGSALFHSGGVYHQGNNITSGKRYVMVGFARVQLHSLEKWATQNWGDLSFCGQVSECDLAEPAGPQADYNELSCATLGSETCRDFWTELVWTQKRSASDTIGQISRATSGDGASTNLLGFLVTWGVLMSTLYKFY
mmetsp:Transcript_41/g.89  ORF Transcript_41/g.89 Transcript_41/m.89 type:complete len:359 (-) Transcript_41:162-1238(-)|eukprot:CAMPEP_0167795406 /NCGR_PEP_ID=MMETSP0111_2-20121227/14421_1 /TAXON_ID=91324 /ORGANISM="Lotharella globosa, Strain CCCM811" /LENGTH=358 /DNA_ID=CAMNT_0007689077 /DNA_START=95 /DNA_END=1171 /DNA_ORIENTATION=-